MLSDPERLRKGLNAMIEEQRGALWGDPEGETRSWLERLAALDRKRDGYLDLAAEGLMGHDELRGKLARLQEERETAERELAAIDGRKERLEQMERDRDAVMERYSGVIPESLDDLSPEERHQIYRMLRLQVLAYPDKSLEVSGALVARVGGKDEEGPDVSRTSNEGVDGALLSKAGLGALGPTQTSSARQPTPRAASSPR